MVSPAVRVSKGADRESEKINEKLRLLPLKWSIRNSIIKLISKL